MSTRLVFGGLLAALAPSLTAWGETLIQRPPFQSTVATRGANGASTQAQVSVQSWQLIGRMSQQRLPLQGFYIAHLLAGNVSATVDGQTTEFWPGAYWTVKAGSTMQLQVLGEQAVLETITVSKQ